MARCTKIIVDEYDKCDVCGNPVGEYEMFNHLGSVTFNDRAAGFVVNLSFGGRPCKDVCRSCARAILERIVEGI